MKKLYTARFAFVATAWMLLLTTPAEAFRMIQQTGTGRFTSGNLVTCGDTTGFTHWHNRTIGWRLNQGNQGAGMNGTVAAAMASWNGVAGSDYQLNLLGNTGAGWATDGANTLLWANGNGCTGTCLALTALVVQQGQVIVESDVTFNNAVAWNTNGLDFDVQAVATHEFGHAIGIHHTNVTTAPRPTMTGNYNLTRVGGRTLEADDRAALQCSVNRYGSPHVRYRAHVQGRGWLGWVEESATGGTTGEGRRMEATQITLVNRGNIGICYRAHVKGNGWLGTVCNGATGGTTGQSRRMEAIQIWLTGAPAGCSVQYRAHVKGNGWLGWVQNGATAGTTGQSRRMEAIQIRLTGC